MGSMRKYKPSVLCSVSLSNKYVIIKACSKNITGSTNLAYSKKVNLQVPVRLSIQGLPISLAKLAKCTSKHIFISILSFALVCLAKVCEHSVLPNVMKYLLVKKTVILPRSPLKILILNSLRC